MGSKMVLFFTVNRMIREWMGVTPLWISLLDGHIYDPFIFHVTQIGEAVYKAEFLSCSLGCIANQFELGLPRECPAIAPRVPCDCPAQCLAIALPMSHEAFEGTTYRFCEPLFGLYVYTFPRSLWLRILSSTSFLRNFSNYCRSFALSSVISHQTSAATTSTKTSTKTSK